MAVRTRAQARFWKADVLDGLELLFGCYEKHAFPRHAHDSYVISVMALGFERLCHRGCVYNAPAGSIVLINPGVWHENRGDRRFAYRTFYPSAPLLERIARDVAGNRPVGTLFETPIISSDALLARRLLDLHSALESNDISLGDEEALSAVFAALLARHAGVSPFASNGPREPRLVTQIRDYLAANMARRVRLADLSALVDRSACHLLRTFRSSTGVTPHQFQIQMRIQRAMTLLRSGHPVSDTAFRLGFGDQSHFTRHFTRTVGVPPGRFARVSRMCKIRPARPT
jgi:AraC-like DNA-binding protein